MNSSINKKVNALKYNNTQSDGIQEDHININEPFNSQFNSTYSHENSKKILNSNINSMPNRLNNQNYQQNERSKEAEMQYQEYIRANSNSNSQILTANKKSINASSQMNIKANNSNTNVVNQTSNTNNNAEIANLKVQNINSKRKIKSGVNYKEDDQEISEVQEIDAFIENLIQHNDYIDNNNMIEKSINIRKGSVKKLKGDSTPKELDIEDKINEGKIISFKNL